MTLIDADTGEVVEVDAADLTVDLDIYPRETIDADLVDTYVAALEAGDAFPPVEALADGRLVDGVHRTRAYSRLGRPVPTVVIAAPDGVTLSLFAASRNRRHGKRQTRAELRALAEREAHDNPECSSTDIAELLGLPRRTVADWIGPIVATHREVRRTQVRLLADAGWTQAAIGKAVGVDQATVSRLCEMADSPDCISPDLVSAAVDRLDGDARDAAAAVAERLAEADLTDEERALLERHRDGHTIVVSMRDGRHERLINMMKANGSYDRIDRGSPWGNPFVEGKDGDRDTVIANYRDHFLPFKPSLDPATLRGKALGCWCHPLPCHGDVLAEAADR